MAVLSDIVQNTNSILPFHSFWESIVAANMVALGVVIWGSIVKPIGTGLSLQNPMTSMHMSDRCRSGIPISVCPCNVQCPDGQDGVNCLRPGRSTRDGFLHKSAIQEDFAVDSWQISLLYIEGIKSTGESATEMDALRIVKI